MKMKRIKPHYIIIPSLWVCISWLRSYLESLGADWYKTLDLPDYFHYVDTFAWPIILEFLPLAMLLSYDYITEKKLFKKVYLLFFCIIVLEELLAYLFFVEHEVKVAFVCASLMLVFAWVVIAELWKDYRQIAALLLPYGVLLFVDLAVFYAYIPVV